MLYLIRHIYDGNIFSYLNPILKSVNLRLDYPENKIGLMTSDKYIIDNNDDLNYLLSSVFDTIYDNTDKIKEEYILIDISNKNYLVGGNHNNDNDNNLFTNLKKVYGDVVSGLFVFKEYEMAYNQNLVGGDFERKLKNKMTDKEKLQRIVKLYDIDENKIRLNHIKYYFTITQNIYRPYHITCMLSKIKPYDYFKPQEIISQYYHQDIFQKYNKYTKSKTKNLMVSELKLDNLDENFILNTYIKSRPNTHIIILWKPLMINNVDELLLEYLKEKGNVYDFKKLRLSRNKLEKLLFIIYDDFTFTRRKEFVQKKLDYILSENDNNDIGFIFFDNVKNLNISGHHSIFKKELRDKTMKLLSDKNDTSELRGSDLIHINNYFYQTIDISNFILDEETFSYDGKYGEYLIDLKFQTLKRILFTNLSLLEIDRIMITNIKDIFGGVIKGLILDVKDGERINKFVNKNLIERKTRYHIFDFKFTDDVDLIINPKNYYYEQGIKIKN